MTATVATSSESSAALTPLAERIEADGPTDSRSCPHNCPGSLSLLDDDRVICQTCRCTPNGVYVPPKGEIGVNEGRCTQSSWFYPYPSRSQSTTVERERYDNSGNVRLPGGYEDVYDEDEDVRPDGVSDEYTFDLSTLDQL